MDTPLDVLAQAEAELAAMDFDETASGLDRRQFMFRSLVAAAASAFGAPAMAGAQGLRAPLIDMSGVWSELQPPAQQPAVPLGNGERPPCSSCRTRKAPAR